VALCLHFDDDLRVNWKGVDCRTLDGLSGLPGSFEMG
jgi:hypothetical protein